jgi:hypothetical protein
LGFESVCLIDLDLLLTGLTSWVDVALATVSSLFFTQLFASSLSFLKQFSFRTLI